MGGISNAGHKFQTVLLPGIYKLIYWLFILIQVPPQQGFFIFIFETPHYSFSVFNNCFAGIEGHFAIHFSTRKMAGIAFVLQDR